MGIGAQLREGVEVVAEVVKEDVHYFCHEEKGYPRVAKLLEGAEWKLGVKRERIAHLYLFLTALYLVTGPFPGVISNSVGLVYPLFSTFKAVCTKDGENTFWITYWTIFILGRFVDFFLELTWWPYFPVYWLLKTLFLVWLYAPVTKGALVVYKHYLEPLVEEFNDYLT